MIKFSKEKILLLHQVMAEATGGDVGVRDDVYWNRLLKIYMLPLTALNYIRAKRKKQQDLAIHLYQTMHLSMVINA